MSLPPFEQVLTEHGPGLLRFCLSRAGAADGEDVFQETMLSALRGYPRLRDAEAVGPWLFAIAARKAVDAHRLAARSPIPVEDTEPLEIETAQPASFDREIWAVVRRLPPKQRQAIGLRFLADLSHAEIGVAMGTSTEAARRNVFEGLRRLRREGLGDLTSWSSAASN